MNFAKTKTRETSQYESSANTDSLTGSQYENCAAAQYEGEAACQGANPARGGSRRRNFDWIFCAGERCGSPTGVTAHSSSATAGANQDHRAGANQDHNPERLWRQRGVVGAARQERDGGLEMRVARVSAGGVGSVTLLVCSARQYAACIQVAQI